MSTTSGPGNKGEKNKGKFKSIDINTLYKGKSVETQKSNVPRQYGLQSLGKVSSARRMPPPANLPSIKSENSGKDPSVSLVPSGGTGWVSKEEKKESTGGPPQQPSLPLQQATQTQPQQGPQQVTTKTNNSSGGQSSMGVRSWSSASGGVRQGGLVSHRSPLFQEEFPSLAQEEKHKEPAPPTKKEDTVKDIPYGPGPSLRPQNVASWREGGGRALPQPKPDERSASSPSITPTEAQPNGPLMSGGGGTLTSGGAGTGVGVGVDLPSQPLPPQRPNSSHGQPHGSLILGPPMRMPPPQHRGMLPHYMFGRISPGGYPINFPGFPRNPFPHDRRFRGPVPSMPVERSRSDGEDNQKRPAIVSEKALKDFDAVLKSDSLEGGWAEPQGDIDYSERLVFSDEEEDSSKTREVRRRPTEAHQRDADRDRDHKEDKDKEDEGGVMVHEGWPHGMPPPHYRGGPMPPHPGMEAHGWPPHMLQYEFMGPRGVAPYPFRLPPPLHMRGYGPSAQPPPQPPVASPGAGPPRKVSEDDDEAWRLKRRSNEGEINSAVERARMRREESEKKKESEQRAAADEKLRQLDERSKKKVDTKGSDTEGRDSRDTSESSDREMREPHHWNRPANLTPPALNEQAEGKGFSRNVPPRFQKLQEPLMGQDQRQKQLPSPGGGGAASPGIPSGPPIPRVFRSNQGPPPHFAGYDPRAWPGMPPHFHMDPRYGPRPNLDMQAVYGPPTVMRRHDSHSSGNDGQEPEPRHLESYERMDPWAAWMERSGYHPQAGHYEDIRRNSYYERAYQQGFDIDRSDFEHHDHGPQADTNKAPKEVEQRPSPHQRDSFEDWNKVNDKEDRRSDRSSSKDHANWDLERSFSKESNKEDSEEHYEKEEEFNQKPSKDELDQEEPTYSRSYNRRDGRTGPTPKFRAYTSEEVRQREASQRAEVFSQNCPPPLSHELNKQAVQAKASLTSLKRSASSMSSSSATSTDKEKDRKNESPKESIIFERSLGAKKDGEKDVPKDEKSPQDKENKPAEQSRPNAWEIKELDRQKVSKVKEEVEVPEQQKEEDERVKTFEERVDSPRGNVLVGKKKREEDKLRDRRDREDEPVKDRRDREDEHLRDRDDEHVRDRREREDEHVRDRREREDEHVRDRRDRYPDDRREKDYDRYNDRGDRARGNANRGGREFVRGRGAPRGSLRGGGYSTGRGRDRDYFPTANEKSGPAPHRQDRQPGKPFQKFDDDKHERDFGANLSPRQKSGPSDGLSDASADDSLGVFHEPDPTTRVHAKEGLLEKEQNHRDFTDNRQQETRSGRDQNKDFRLDQEHKNIWAQEKLQEEPAPPSLFQNAWFKSQPLLPDPPKSEWIPDESSLAYQKSNKTHNVNVWQQRLESRRPNNERSYGESHGSGTTDKNYEANHRDGRDNRQRHDRDRPGYNWGSDGQSERKDRRDNGPSDRKDRRDTDLNERKERRDNDSNVQKERRDNEANERRERRDNDPIERKEKRDIDSNERSERRGNDPTERSERRGNDPTERRDVRYNDPNERRERRDIDSNERREKRDIDSNERREKIDSDPIETKDRKDNDPNERKERRDNDSNVQKERRDIDPNERKERRGNEINEWKVRRDNDPNERNEKRENDPHESKERSESDPNDLKERRENDPIERNERRDSDLNEWKIRRNNDPNERKEKRENDQHDRKERRENDPNDRKERREHDPQERKERRDNVPSERKERRDNVPSERKDRRDNEPNERKDRRDNEPNERKDRRDNEPNERKDRRDNEPNERKDRRDNEPNERKEKDSDQQERKERRDNNQLEGNERREYDPNERKERRDDPNERKERRDDPNERKERRDDPNERRDRRDNPNERRERREMDPTERKERRDNNPGERKDRRDKYRDRDRYRDRRGHQHEQDQDEENGTSSYPRGEHFRRGRGGSRGGSRYTNAPSNYGGGGQGYGGRGANGDSNVSEHAGGFVGDHLQNRDRGHDGRDGHVDGRNHRRDGRRQDDRNPPPPRFRRDEVMFDHRGPGSDRGRGRSSRGQGAGTQSNSISKRPVLTKQVSNDGEEWETASESSEPKNGLRESRENMTEISTTKKGVSNQRPFSDRPSNHRLNYQDSRNSVERCNFHIRDDQQNQKNGAVPPMKSAANGATATKAATVSIVGHKESATYRGDGGVTSDTAGGSNGLTRKQADKKSEINDAHNKALKAEQERKDAMANIDINNIAGVVVVDDMQEVTLDDPDFLYEVNDGFQEVTSKRTLKIKQKLIEAEHKKTEKEALRKKEQHNKAAARSKCMSPKSGHMNVKGNKLPPRLAKQKEQREKEKLMTKDVMPKIELWDNELANNLPCLDGSDIVPTSSVTFSDNIGVNVPLYTMTVTNKASMAPVMMSFSMTPAPAPPINAWMKPISFSPSPTLGTTSQLQQTLAATSEPPQPVAPTAAAADVKMDKGDQHDSGIDVSDQPNSASSSSRSSPGTENRLVVSTTISHSPVIDHSAAAVLKRNIPMDASQMITEIPKQQRLPKVSSKSEKSYVKAEANPAAMKKMDMSPVKERSDTKPEPIQMPPGYKDSIFGKGDHVNLELDFHYDESLSNSLAPISERAPTPEKVEATFSHNENIHLSAPVATPQTLMPPTSPATEVLSSKIASVKNFWDLDLPTYDHMACMTNAAPIDDDCQQSAIYVSNTNTNNVSSTSTANNTVFPVFGPEIVGDEGVTVSEGQPALEEDTSSTSVAASTVVSVAPVPRRSPVIQCMHSPHPAESVADDVLEVSHSEMIHDEKNMILEPSNVCKVRPQQLQMGLGLGNEAISMSMLSSGISGSMLSSGIGGSMPTVASPPMMIGQHGFPAFQFGSQFVPQEARYTQPSFGYSLSQPQPPAGMGNQHQTPGTMGPQQTFNQPSLFISSARNQAEYLSSSQLGFPQRGHGFGQPTAPAPPPAAQQSAILAPTATATLMPTNLKVPGSSLAMGPGPASAFGAEPLGKAMGPSQISFSNGLGSTSIPGAASQQLFFYDPNPTLGQLFQSHSQILTGGQGSQNLAGSQMLGSQLLQTRGAVQPSSAFYQQPPAAGYFPAQQSSAIQVGGPIQQQSSNQFSVQAFGNQHHGLGLALQPPVSSLEMSNQNPSTLSLHGLPHQQSQALSNKGSSFGSVVAGHQQTHQHFAATYNQQSPYSGHSHHPHHHLQSSQLNAFLGGHNNPQDHMSVKQFESSHTKSNMSSSSNPNHFGDSMRACPPGSAMMSGMLVSSTSYSSGGANTKSSNSGGAGAAISPLDGSHVGVDRTTSMSSSISGPPSPQPPPASQPAQKSLISRALDTSTSHLNPNAPVFPATTKYSCSTAVGVPSTTTSNITSAFVPSGTSQHQPQISVGKTRPTSAQGAHNVRPPFPNPIQRPDGSPATSSSSQAPDMQQQFGHPNNNARMPLNQVTSGQTSHSNSSYGAPVPNSPYLSVMNLRNTALLSLISAAKNVIDQTIMSSGGSHLPGDNPFSGRAPGTYMGPGNMDGPQRTGAYMGPGNMDGPQRTGTYMGPGNMDGPQRTGAYMGPGNMDGPQRTGAYMGPGNMDGPQRTGAYMGPGNMDGPQRTGAYMGTGNMDGPQRTGAYMGPGNMDGPQRTGAYMGPGNMDGPQRTGPYMSQANMDGSKKTEAYMDGPQKTGTYMGPANMDGSQRPGPPTTKKGISPSVNQKGPSVAPQQNPAPNPGQSQNPAKVPVTFPAPVGNIKAQQALQRQELLNHAATFLNAGKAPSSSKPSLVETTPVAANTPITHARKPGDRKPALAMVSNPGLVGTSVKINFTASNNARAPALPVATATTVSATASLASPNNKSSTNSSCTISVSAATAASSANSSGHKEGKENP